ncbi:MAG: hypothetical protein PHS82_00725 [Lachnospiraceae bacterium]|nr:hypothetical protein [Lachnospiraceae bacterium]
MVELIVVSHGNFAKALLGSAELVMGEQENVTTFGFHLGENVEDLRNKIEEKIKAIQKESPESEILVLTDMKSGSPFNASTMLMQNYDFYQIAGINLPIFLEILGTREFETAASLSDMATTLGKETIVDVKKLMED